MKLSFKPLWALALVILVSLSSCKKDDDPTSLSCDLQTAAIEFNETSISITYKLKNTGDAKVASLFYYDETGKVEVQNPTMPWEMTLTLTNQKTMQAGAKGNVTNGSIEVSYLASIPGSRYESSDFCSQSSN